MAIINKVSFDENVIGTVLEINKENRNIAVYIPKFMPGIVSGSAQSQSIRTSNNLIITGIENESQVTIRNSIWVQPEDFREPLPKIGSKVHIWIIDGNPKTTYWSAFNPNNNYEVLDEEKYNELFTLGVGDQSVQILEQDNVILELPSSFEVIKNINDLKKVTLKINMKELYIISESTPANPVLGTLWFKPSTEELKLYKNDSFKKMITEEEIDAKIAVLTARIDILHP